MQKGMSSWWTGLEQLLVSSCGRYHCGRSVFLERLFCLENPTAFRKHTLRSARARIELVQFAKEPRNPVRPDFSFLFVRRSNNRWRKLKA